MSRRARARTLAKVNRDSPGASSRDLDPGLVARVSSGKKGSGGIDQGNGADWFGPEDPISPMAPDEVAGRRFDFPVGYNLQQTPRANESTSFSQLRALADCYDVLRTVIETRKDQIEKLNWSIKARTDANGNTASASKDVIQEISTFLETPDGVNDWGVWLRMLLEDMFVIDAATIYCERTRGGKLLGLRQLDGATIKRVIDDWGGTPMPPVVAYQQVLKGMPAVNYTADDLIYLPRNPRVGRVYGLSPVEQIVMIVNIGLRRELFQLQYYSEGNIPEALVGTPDDWTPEQIKKFQVIFDDMLAGNSAARRRLKFVPGGVAKTFVATKEVELTNKTDEWLARVVCYAFSVPPTPFITQMNRATAETAHDAALQEGLAPVMNWVKRLIDRIIRRFWPASGVEFSWNDDREVDAAVQQTTLTGYVTNGILKINEARDTLGLAPEPDGDKLMVKTATGYVEVGAPPPEPGPIAAGGHPSTSGTTGKDEEAPATKSAGAFRKAAYWKARPPHAPHARSAAGAKAPRA